MQIFRISVSTLCFGQSLKLALRTAASAGVQGVQLDVRDELRPSELSETGRRQLVHQLTELGLKVAAVNFPLRRGLGDQLELDARVAAIKSAMEFAWSLQAPILSARIGKLPADVESKQYQLMLEVLSDIVRHGNHVGTTLAIAPTHDSPEALQTLVGAVQTGPVGIDFDPAGFVSAGYNAVAALRALHAQVVHFEARDAIRDVDGTGQEVALGRGETDWTELLVLLHEMEYRGWVNVNRTQGEDRAGDASRAVKFLQNAFF